MFFPLSSQYALLLIEDTNSQMQILESLLPVCMLYMLFSQHLLPVCSTKVPLNIYYTYLELICN